MRMLTVVLMLGALTASADTVTLKSGTVLTGTVLGTAGDDIKIKTDDFGELSVKKASVVRIVDAAAKSVEPATLAPVPVPPPPPETWHGSVHAGFKAARGNTYDNSGSVTAQLKRRWEKDRFQGDFGYYYADSGETGAGHKKTEDRWEAEVKHDHFWFEKIYHYENGKYERDDIQNLIARYRLGLGGGYQWLDGSPFDATGKWSFNQEFGVSWIKENYSHSDDEKQDGFAALRYAHHLVWIPKWSADIEVFHNAEIVPDVDEWEKFLAKSDFGFKKKLMLDFDLLVKLEWDYNSMPADDRKKSDYRYTVGLGYGW